MRIPERNDKYFTSFRKVIFLVGPFFSWRRVVFDPGWYAVNQPDLIRARFLATANELTVLNVLGMAVLPPSPCKVG